MKKIYCNPITEAITIKATWAMCTESPANHGVTSDPGDPEGAPRRKVF